MNEEPPRLLIFESHPHPQCDRVILITRSSGADHAICLPLAQYYGNFFRPMWDVRKE